MVSSTVTIAWSVATALFQVSLRASNVSGAAHVPSKGKFV